MTLSEFHDANADVLLERVAPDALLDACTDGSVFFLVSTRRSSKPLGGQNVAYAKYAMPVAWSPREGYVQFLCLTEGGHAKIQALYPADLEDPSGAHALYRVAPMAPDDPRRGKWFREWPAPHWTEQEGAHGTV